MQAASPHARGKTKSSKANFQEARVSYYRTPEHRRLRAALIRQWKPWEKSTEPKSSEGKTKVSQNAFKGGGRKQLRELRRVLREQAQAVDGY